MLPPPGFAALTGFFCQTGIGTEVCPDETCCCGSSSSSAAPPLGLHGSLVGLILPDEDAGGFGGAYPFFHIGAYGITGTGGPFGFAFAFG